MADRNSAFMTITDWIEFTGMGRARVYDALSRRNLRAKKVGRRTLIDVQHGLRWLRSQPDAEINLKRAPKGSRAGDPAPAP